MQIRNIVVVLALAVVFAACGKDHNSMTLNEFTALPQADQLEIMQSLSAEDQSALASAAVKYGSDQAKLGSMTIKQAIEEGKAK